LARFLFHPTLWWNVLLNKVWGHQRRWWDWIDDDVLLGALPFPRHVIELKKLGIGGVVNTCCEYEGPLDLYREADIEQLALPTVDFTPPSLDQVQAGVSFMQKQVAAGRKVYVHCKAGRARSATIVICYLIQKGMTPKAAQQLLLEKRPHVMPELHRRKVVREFAEQQTVIGAK
jgi:atypical dual specificity phosphatase